MVKINTNLGEHLFDERQSKKDNQMDKFYKENRDEKTTEDLKYIFMFFNICPECRSTFLFHFPDGNLDYITVECNCKLTL